MDHQDKVAYRCAILRGLAPKLLRADHPANIQLEIAKFLPPFIERIIKGFDRIDTAELDAKIPK